MSTSISLLGQNFNAKDGRLTVFEPCFSLPPPPGGDGLGGNMKRSKTTYVRCFSLLKRNKIEITSESS